MSVVKVLALATTAVLGLVSAAAAQDTTAAAPTPVARSRARHAPDDRRRQRLGPPEARALDANGRPLPEAKIVFKTRRPGAGAGGGGRLVRAGSVGDVPLIATAIVPGTKPYIEHLSVRVVPGPARQRRDRRRAGAAGAAPARAARRGVLSAEGDARGDAVAWSSSAPSVARVNRDGLLEARAAGRATVRASSRGTARRAAGRGGRRRRRRRSRSSPRRPRCVRATSFASPPPPAAPPIGRSRDSRPPGRSVRAKGTSTTTARSLPYEPGTYTVTAALGGRSATAEVTVGAARGAPAGDRRRRGGAEGLSHRRGLAASQRQGRVPRHPPRWRPALHHRRQRSRQAGRGRLGAGEHPRDQRHHDRQGGQGPGVHPRGRGRPEERHRHLHAGGSAAPQGRRRVHRGRHRRRPLRVHLLPAQVRHPGLPDQRRHRRAPRRGHHRSGPSEGSRPLEDAARRLRPVACTTSTCRTGWCTPAGGTTGW